LGISAGRERNLLDEEQESEDFRPWANLE